MSRSDVATLAERVAWPRSGEFTADLEGLVVRFRGIVEDIDADLRSIEMLLGSLPQETTTRELPEGLPYFQFGNAIEIRKKQRRAPGSASAETDLGAFLRSEMEETLVRIRNELTTLRKSVDEWRGEFLQNLEAALEQAPEAVRQALAEHLDSVESPPVWKPLKPPLYIEGDGLRKAYSFTLSRQVQHALYVLLHYIQGHSLVEPEVEIEDYEKAEVEGLAHDLAHTATRFRQLAHFGGSSYDNSVIVLAHRVNQALTEPIEILREARLLPSQ